MKLFNICIVVGTMFLGACASSGGGSSPATPSVAVAPQPSSTPTDQRIAFASWTDTYTPGVSGCLLYTSPSPRDLSTSRMPSSA